MAIKVLHGASEKLIADLSELFKLGNVYEKTVVLTDLVTAKLYFGEDKYEGYNI